uniref:Gustatory receptor n=1 Tax=Tetranychus urticae TaxID=32264 RepID=T1KCN1_TETUR
MNQISEISVDISKISNSSGLLFSLLLNLNKKIGVPIVAFCGITSIIGGIFDLNNTNSPTESDETLSLFNHAWLRIYSIYLGTTLLQFLVQRSNYKRFVYSIASLVSTECPSTKDYVTRQHGAAKLFITCSLVFELALTIYSSAQSTKETMKNSSMLIIVSSYYFNLTAACNWIMVLQFIIESCIHLKSSLVFINQTVSSIQSDNLTIEKVRVIRSTYSSIIRITRRLDSFLVYSLFGFYLSVLFNCHLHFTNLFINNKLSTMNLLCFIGTFSYLLFVTYHTVTINYLVIYFFEQIYSLSFLLFSTEINAEINLFLQRIGHFDVGLTFAKLCIITPSFVASFATVLLSIALAAPSFRLGQ